MTETPVDAAERFASTARCYDLAILAQAEAERSDEDELYIESILLHIQPSDPGRSLYSEIAGKIRPRSLLLGWQRARFAGDRRRDAVSQES